MFTFAKFIKFSKNEIIKALIMGSTYFSFERKYYLQVYIFPMGGLCSTIIADIVMENLETECLSKLDFTTITLLYFNKLKFTHEHFVFYLLIYKLHFF